MPSRPQIDSQAPPVVPRQPSGASASRAAYRPDIEGLRTVAVGLVLVYHAGVRQLPGGFVGVDVFFVISGFLITGLLIRELEQHGRISLGRFYARRAKRLLPATGVVLVVTAALTALTVSIVQWRDFGLDIVASALYVINWRLAARSVDYLAEDVGASPVQHFWSLAVEEQFYIVWPLLLVALAWWLRRSRSRGQERPLRPVLLVGILLVIVPSFLYSVVLTALDPALAYFVTPTRLWELGIGALVAIGAGVWGRLPRAGAVVLGWAGLAAVVGSGLLMTTATPWPGSAALVPTLGTAGIIVAGYTSGPAGPAGVLGWRPAVWIGGLSYSLYLWHWPLVVAATAWWGGLSPARGLLVVAVSFVPAYLTSRLVENPIRFSRSLSRSHRRVGAVAVGFTAVAVVAGLVVSAAVPSTDRPDERETAAGAVALETDPEQGTLAAMADVEWYVPQPTEAEDDLPDGYADECQVAQTSSEPSPCIWGDPEGDVTLAVVGDSKMLQWQSALDAIGREEGWRIVAHTKSACGFHAGMQARGSEEPYTQCAEWNDAVAQELVELDPDVLLTSQRSRQALTDPTDVETGTEAAMVEAMAASWQDMSEAGIPVAVLLDNPSPTDGSVYECVAEHPEALADCAYERGDGIDGSAAPAQRAAAEQVPGSTVLDLTRWICPAQECVPIIGNALIYRQGSHLTDTYVRTLQGPLAEELVPVVRR